jgi:ATP-binding cassette ChvD family protein
VISALAAAARRRYISFSFSPTARLCGHAQPERNMARQFVYHMKDLTKAYPGNRKVLENVNLSFYPDAKIGVLGVNGAGKSTLLRIMAGLDTDYHGEAWVAEGARVGYLPQEPQLDPAKSVRENVMEGVAPQKAVVDRYNELATNYSDETADEMTKLQDEIEAKGLWDLDSKVDLAMDALRCPADDAEVATLSGGERRRVALCRLLLEQPELLLLDEPTNHLDAESVAWLESHLRKYPGAILIVTHDRYFLDNVTSWILELDRGRGIPYEGNYSSWLGQKRKRLEQEGREEEAHQRTLAREQEWISASPRARQAKSKARYERYEELLKKAGEKQTQTAQIVIPVAERLGQNVIDFEHLKKGFGDNLLIDDLTFKLPPGGIVGIIGPNGAGKTTLFRMITEQEKADQGTIKVGESVHLGYVDQSRDSLDGKKSVWEEISGGLDQLQLGKREVNSRAYCSAFNFKGADQQKKVGSLSGGERNRVHLAKMLKSGANVLLLDEPTNDLDVDTLRALEEALEDFAGCAVIISHDRWFLDRIATHILAFEGDSHVEWFEGNFQDYEQDKMRRLGTDSIIPQRIKYQKFSR